MKRLWIALGAYVVLGVLTAVTIDDQKFKLATLAILALFAVRTLTWHRRMEHQRGEPKDE